MSQHHRSCVSFLPFLVLASDCRVRVCNACVTINTKLPFSEEIQDSQGISVKRRIRLRGILTILFYFVVYVRFDGFFTNTK